MPNPDFRPDVVFRPTVVIGLGGTGYGALLKLKKRFVDTYGTVPPIIQLLSIDTTENAKQREATSEGLSVQLDPNEKYQISVANPTQVVRGNPHIQEWWPPQVDSRSLTDGAGQVRARGRLGLFAAVNEISGRIQTCINQVRDLKNNKQADAQDLMLSNTGGVEVYVVASLAGGTGSGTFLDVALMARRNDPNISVTGVLALPRVFSGKPFTESVQSNAYGALKEIEYFWSAREVEIDYGNQTLEVLTSPFDILYLMDSLNENGKVVNDPSDLQTLMADGLYVQIGSQIGVDTDNTTDNVKTQLSENLVKKRRVSYCSFGIASLTLPVQQYETMQLEDAQQLIRRNLLGGLDEADTSNVLKDVENFIQDSKLTESVVLEALSEKPDGGQMRFQMNLAGMGFDQNAVKTIKDLHTRYYDSMEQQVAQRLGLNLMQMQATVIQSLDAWWEKAINRDRGLSYSRKFLETLKQKIDWDQGDETGYKQSCQNQSAEMARRLQTLSFGAREAKISDVANTLNPFGRDKKIEAACQNYAGLVKTQCQIYLQGKRCDRAAELFGAISSHINQLLDRQEQIQRSLEKCVANFQERVAIIKSQGKSDNPFEHQLTRFDVEGNRPQITYEDFSRWCRDRDNRLSDWSNLTTQQIQTKLEQFFSESYRVLAGMSIDEVLRNSDPEAVAKDLDQLWDISCPLWRYDEAKIPTKDSSVIQESCYYGVQDAGQTALRDPEFANRLPRGSNAPSFVSTSEPHRITLFRVKVGVPLFALYGIEEMEQAYKDPNKAFKHLHKNWESFPDLIPPEDDGGALTWFALGMALNIIYKKGRKYYIQDYTASSRYDSGQAVTLGSGRVEALQTFKKKKNQTLVQATETQVEQKLDHIRDTEGEEEVSHFLNQYADKLAKQLQTSKEISLDLKQQVQAEIDVIEEYLEAINPHGLD